MSKILVSLLSKYLQPNFLFIKEMDGKFDKLLFVTTKEMENEKNKSSKFLCDALRIKHDKVNLVTVIEDDESNISSKLTEVGFGDNDDYIVNLTGGTKVMSIVTYRFFCNFPNVQLYYIPEGKNEIKRLDGKTEAIPLSYRMNLNEYFTINRLRYEAEMDFDYNEVFVNKLFEQFKAVGFNRYKVSKFRNAHNLQSPKEKVFYSGQWFEDYSYYRLKRQFQLDDDCICRGAKIYSDSSALKTGNTNDNEVDVMFVRDNKLYIFECKQSLKKGNASEKDTLDSYMYKLAAIAKDFGLRVNSYILTLHRSSTLSEQLKQNAKRRCELLGLKKVLTSEDFAKNVLELN